MGTARLVRTSLLAGAVVVLVACGSSGGGSKSTASVAAPAASTSTAPSATETPAATEAPTVTETPVTPTEAPTGTEVVHPLLPADFVLRIGAIPDQDPEKLAREFGAVSTYLSAATGARVEFVPVADYPAAVTGFKVGDLDLVWFGGLTGVQAQVPNAVYIAQRDADATFQSVFIANASAAIAAFDEVAGLSAVTGHSLTFGSESSTSGRLMPEYFLRQASVAIDSLKGQPGFSGSHDKTIKLVDPARSKSVR